MEIHIRLPRRGELTGQIDRQLLDAVLDGRLRPEERLPPTRELARRLDVSRNTVGVAYDQLAAGGVLVGRVGAATGWSSQWYRQSQQWRWMTASVRASPITCVLNDAHLGQGAVRAQYTTEPI